MISKIFFRRLMADKRNLFPNVPISTGGAGDPPLSFYFHTFWVWNYLFLHPCWQFRQCLSIWLLDLVVVLDSVSPFITGYASFADSIAPPDPSLIPTNSGPSHTESDVVEDLSIRLTTQSVFPPWMDWYGPTGPGTSYMAPVQSDPMILTSRNPYSDIQRFYQDFRLPNYSLDTFSGRLFDIVFKYNLCHWQCTNRASSCHY